MKIPDAKAAVDKESKKLEAIQPGSWKSQKWKGGYSGSAKRQEESPLCHIDGHRSSQECGIRTEISEVQRSSRCSIY